MKLKFKVDIVEVDNTFMAVPVENNGKAVKGMMKLNQTGADIIKLLDGEKSVEQIVEELSKSYKATKEELTSAVVKFTEQLKKLGVIE